jgi:hypothetical protein
MATFAVFIHTLVFKNILTNKQGAMLYQAGYPYATRNTAPHCTHFTHTHARMFWVLTVGVAVGVAVAVVAVAAAGLRFISTGRSPPRSSGTILT